MSSAPPEGYVEFSQYSGNAFMIGIGPLYMKMDAGDGPVFGFRVEERHCNGIGICHGGMIATFADIFLPTQVRFDPAHDDGYTPTVSLTLDFLGPARVGQWVEGRGRLLRRTGRLIFVEGLVSADGSPVMRASGTFKRGKAGERTDTNELLQGLIGTWKNPPAA